MDNIVFYNPVKTDFGQGALNRFAENVLQWGNKRLFMLVIPEIRDRVEIALRPLLSSGCKIVVNDDIRQEPSFGDYRKLLRQSDTFKPDCVVGIGGGSVLDTAKLIAATTGTDTRVEEFLTGKKALTRKTKLVCIPTTAGTGSEVSPNAIFFDPETGGKVGVIDPQLVPDAAYIDPELTVSVPPTVTASTGLDALTHCIEAYVNRFAHPMTDLLALEGISLIGQNLERAFKNGRDIDAREKVALGSMYGGMCLGPVNTGAVHALAYPLGSMFKVAHGVANALLLPFVMEFNLESAVEKYANAAIAMGARPGNTNKETALAGIKLIKGLVKRFGIPCRLSELNIKQENIEEMAQSAMKIQRLLKNNVREVSLADAIEIYRKAL